MLNLRRGASGASRTRSREYRAQSCSNLVNIRIFNDSIVSRLIQETGQSIRDSLKQWEV